MSKENQVKQAPPRCYQVLSAVELAIRTAGLPEHVKGFHLLLGPLTTFPDIHGHTLYPAFQFEPRLDLKTFAKLRQLYTQSGVSERCIWDFLRTRHSDLGGTTGVDFLLGYFNPEVAALCDEDRLGHFLDLAREDIERSTQ